MLVLLIVLIVTNLVTLGALAWFLLQPAEDRRRPEAGVAPALPTDRTGMRRVITIEVLNPIELAGNRNRWAGIAGSVAPGLTHRFVHDVLLRSLRRQLAEQGVAADVRLHVVDIATPVYPVTPEGARSRECG